MHRALAVVSVLAFPLILAAAQSEQALVEHAKRLHKEVPLIDGHNDYPWEVRHASFSLDTLDISKRQPKTMTDIPRLREGGVGGQFWSVYIPADFAGQKAVTATLEEIDTVYRMNAKYPDTFEQALSADDVERIFKKGKIASMIGMEGGHSIGDSLGALRMFYRMGARYMTLTHGKNVPWADSATDTPAHGGLTAFGEEVVREMNRLGMLVDLSHTSPDTMAAALRVTASPVIFSHSNARAVCDVPRNVPDNILQMLPKNGGIVMVTFVPEFISPEVAAWAKLHDAERDRVGALTPNNEEAVSKAMQPWMEAHPAPKATIAQLADHIDHIRTVAGVDHIGIGSDFDGITSTPVGLEDVSRYPNLTAELIRRGYSDGDIKKILGVNILRVMRQNEAVAAQLQKERKPSTMLMQE
jgi:membrane dipeptidase